MTFALSWLADVLRDAGLNVVEEPGWKTRGHGDMRQVQGILCHHTAGPRNGNAPSLKIVVDGDQTLEGPRAQLVLGRDGTYFVVAAGKAYHAGKGSWPPMNLLDNGNGHLIGIEAENTGLDNDQPWPDAQMEAYAKGCAAMIKHLGLSYSAVIGHKEYAPNRKIDPTFDMDAFRRRVGVL